MKLSTQMLARIATVSILSVGISGIASADSVGLSTTGPSSNNTVTVNNSSNTTVTNNSTVQIVNENQQVATSGDVQVSDNTVADGPITSGNVTNNNATTTAVNIDNSGSVVGTTPGGGLGGSTGGSTPGGSTPVTGGTGSVLGASTGGLGGGSVAMLPAVGASVPVDVSALRALYHPASIMTPTATLVHASQAIPAAFLGLASLLSLLGAVLTIVYNRRQKRQTI